jgi:hypothetical protein
MRARSRLPFIWNSTEFRSKKSLWNKRCCSALLATCGEKISLPCSPGFSVETRGFDVLHAALSKKSRTQGKRILAGT